jgi:hypothetical protein
MYSTPGFRTQLLRTNAAKFERLRKRPRPARFRNHAERLEVRSARGQRGELAKNLVSDAIIRRL